MWYKKWLETKLELNPRLKPRGNTIKVLIKQQPKIPRVERVCNAPNAHRAKGGETEKRAHG